MVSLRRRDTSVIEQGGSGLQDSRKSMFTSIKNRMSVFGGKLKSFSEILVCPKRSKTFAASMPLKLSCHLSAGCTSVSIRRRGASHATVTSASIGHTSSMFLVLCMISSGTTDIQTTACNRRRVVKLLAFDIGCFSLGLTPDLCPRYHRYGFQRNGGLLDCLL